MNKKSASYRDFGAGVVCGCTLQICNATPRCNGAMVSRCNGR